MGVKIEPKAPCKDCIKRHLGCHSECLEYIQFRAERDLWLEEKRDAYRKYHDAIAHDKEKFVKKMHWKRNHE